MFVHNLCTIFLIMLSCITHQTYAYNNYQPCTAYPLIEISSNKSVHFSTSFKANYYEASHYCRKHCMQLASINSQIEQKGIENYIKNSPYPNESFWTSGSDLAEEGVFVWGSTGERLTYTNWLSGQPDNYPAEGQTENCLHIWSDHNYGWNDGLCTTRIFFICESQ